MEVDNQQSKSTIVQSQNGTENDITANIIVESRDEEQKLEQTEKVSDSLTAVESAGRSPSEAAPETDTSIVATEKPTEGTTIQNREPDQKSTARANPHKEHSERSKEDEKLAMYKALAIKLKKELVKSREELTRLKDSSQIEGNTLKSKVETLEKTLEFEQQTCETSVATLGAKVRTLQQQLSSTESELQSIQNDFESYKIMASKIMQQNASTQVNTNRTFEEERYKQLKELSDDQRKRISYLESQLELSLKKNDEFSKKSQQLQDDSDKLRERLKRMDTIVERCEILSNENDNLKSALSRFRSKLTEPRCSSRDRASKLAEGANKPTSCDRSCNILSNENQNKVTTISTCLPIVVDNLKGDVSPSASVKDESHTNSSSSYDGSTSGYVHIKPATFEIISRSSVLDDAQNQIDNLTKAYLDSESMNSLLTEQVEALKEEIRRLQRGSERLVLAENLEYLKNVVFKFLSLDSGQVERKQRLIPVLSTVLKLSPDETAKLNSLAVAERPSMASSFFKL